MSAFGEAWQDAHDYQEALGYPEQDCCDYADKRITEVTEDNTWWHKLDGENNEKR